MTLHIIIIINADAVTEKRLEINCKMFIRIMFWSWYYQ